MMDDYKLVPLPILATESQSVHLDTIQEDT